MGREKLRILPLGKGVGGVPPMVTWPLERKGGPVGGEERRVREKMVGVGGRWAWALGLSHGLKAGPDSGLRPHLSGPGGLAC